MTIDMGYFEIGADLNRDPTKSFAVGEELAHGQAYKTYDHHEGQIIALKDSSGKVEEYTVVKLNSGKNGIVGEIYVPVDARNAKVHVVIAGTHNLATAHLDTEKFPGEETFLKCKEQMMAQIGEVTNQVAKRSNKSVQLNVAGHSLGGALASLVAIEAMRYKAQTALKNNPLLLAEEEMKLGKQRVQNYGCAHKPVSAKDAQNFAHVGGIKVYAWNPAGISQAVSDYSSTIGDALMENDVNVAARVGFVAGDAVQQTGESAIFADASKVYVEFMKVDSGQEGKNSTFKAATGAVAGAAAGAVIAGPIGAVAGAFFGGLIGPVNGGVGTAKAHTATHFDENQETTCPKAKLYNNQTSEGKATYKKEAQNKSKLTNSYVGKAITWAFNKLGKLAGWSGDTVTAENKAIPEQVKPKACKVYGQ